MTDFKRVFIDTNPFIYLLDAATRYTRAMEFIMNKLLERNSEFYSSPVTVAEYLVYPYREKHPEKIEKFLSFIDDMSIKIVPISVKIADISSAIRAEYISFKGMDAFQLATAKYTQCDLFLTNDKQLCRYKDVHCMTIEDCFQRLSKEK